MVELLTRNEVRVAMEQWIDFYAEFFESRAAAEEFVTHLEATESADPMHVAKIMMHQTKRLVSISDRVHVDEQNHECLRLLFLIVCAENISKLHDDYLDDGRSSHYTHRFFEELLDPVDRQRLVEGIRRNGGAAFSLSEVVDILYKLRCDVAHEGRYWHFHFADTYAIVNTDPHATVSMRFGELRGIVVRGCIRAINNYAPE